MSAPKISPNFESGKEAQKKERHMTGGPTFENSVEALVNHVKNNMTQENPWVTLTYRDVPAITGMSQYHAKKLYEALKDHENIDSKIDNLGRSSKKPLKFRFIDESLKLEKLDTKRFPNLTKSDIDFVKRHVASVGYRFIVDTLNIVNLIKALEADSANSPINIDAKIISDMLLERESKVEMILKSLKDGLLLIDNGNTCRLILNSNERKAARGRQIKAGNDSEDRDVRELENDKPENDSDNRAFVESPIENSLQRKEREVIDTTPEGIVNTTSTDLSTNFNMFLEALSGIQNDFRQYIDEEIVQEIEKNKLEAEKFEKGHETITKVIEENESLKRRVSELEKKNAELNRSLDATVRYKNEFITEAQSNLQMLLAQIVATTSQFANMPRFQITEKVSAKYQSDIISSVTEAVNAIVDFKPDRS